MVKVIHVDDNGAEMARVEIDDFTIETVYAGTAACATRRTLPPGAPSAREDPRPYSQLTPPEPAICRVPTRPFGKWMGF
jgi:hypothetical protein